MQTRLLTSADAAAYWHIRQEMLEREPDAFTSSAEEHRTTSVEETAARIGSDPANNFIVGALVDGELVGTAGFYRERGIKTQHTGHVWGVYVTERARGAGIGRMLMKALVERAASVQGLEQIALSVTTTKTAAVALRSSSPQSAAAVRTFVVLRRHPGPIATSRNVPHPQHRVSDHSLHQAHIGQRQILRSPTAKTSRPFSRENPLWSTSIVAKPQNDPTLPIIRSERLYWMPQSVLTIVNEPTVALGFREAAG